MLPKNLRRRRMHLAASCRRAVPAPEGAKYLPGRLRNTWNLATQREATEAQATYPELAEESAWASADLAAVVLARRKLRLACVLYSFCCRSHEFLFFVKTQMPKLEFSRAERHAQVL